MAVPPETSKPSEVPFSVPLFMFAVPPETSMAFVPLNVPPLTLSVWVEVKPPLNVPFVVVSVPLLVAVPVMVAPFCSTVPFVPMVSEPNSPPSKMALPPFTVSEEAEPPNLLYANVTSPPETVIALLML